MRFSVFDNDGNLGDGGVGASAGAVLGGGGASAGAGGSLGGGQTGVGAGAGGDSVLGREVVLEIKGSVNRTDFLALTWLVSQADWIKNVLEARGWNIRNAAEAQSVGNQRTWRVTANVGNQYSDSQIVTNARNHLTERGVTVASVNIVQASPASYVQGVNASSGGDGSNVGLNINSMIAGAAVGLGVSSTVLLIGGGVVLVLLLKRR